METTFKDVLEYVHSKATSQEVTVVFAAAKERQKTLRSIEAALNVASLKKGDTVEIHGIRPAYLNGLTGTVLSQMVGGRRAAFNIQLTGEDAATYRYKSKRGFGDDAIAVDGIPAECLTKVETDA